MNKEEILEIINAEIQYYQQSLGQKDVSSRDIDCKIDALMWLADAIEDRFKLKQERIDKIVDTLVKYNSCGLSQELINDCKYCLQKTL